MTDGKKYGLALAQTQRRLRAAQARVRVLEATLAALGAAVDDPGPGPVCDACDRPVAEVDSDGFCAACTEWPK